jgi:hypothetical protein
VSNLLAGLAPHTFPGANQKFAPRHSVELLKRIGIRIRPAQVIGLELQRAVDRALTVQCPAEQIILSNAPTLCAGHMKSEVARLLLVRADRAL